MIQLLIFLALGIFVAVLMRKKRHKPNKKFSPKPTSKSFSRNPNNKRKSEINKAQLLIDDYLKEFDEWASSRQLRPSILSIKSKIKNLIEKNYKIELKADSSDKLENKTDDLDVQMNNIYSKLSDHLVRKIRVASKNGKDKNALKIIKKIFEDDQ